MRLRVYPALLLLLISICLIPLHNSAAQALEESLSLPLDEAWAPYGAGGRILNAMLAAPEGSLPAAPRLSWWWLLDPGERIEGAELLPGREDLIRPGGESPLRAPLIDSTGEATRLTGGEPLLGSAYDLDISPVRTLHGLRFQSITLTPLRRAEGGLYVLRETRVILRFAADNSSLPPTSPLRPDFPLRERVLTSLGSDLLNPERLPLDLPPGSGERAVGGGVFPSGAPNVEASMIDMVIVTVDSMMDLCEDFAMYRTRRGVATVVRSVEWIAEQYPYGSDRQEMVRNFVIDAYAKWGIKYLLIVGDSDELPPRYAFTTIFNPNRTSPTDMYYACLDGDWNADHDAFWAEGADTSAGDPGDEADLLPEVIVGRIPAADREECEILLQKSENYQSCTAESYQDRILMLGEVLFPSDWEYGQSIIYDGAEYCDSVYTAYTDERHEVVRLYENYYDYPGSYELTRQATLDSLENGWGLVLHNGHGARQTMSVGDGSLDATMVSDLENGDRSFLLYMVNCTAAAFDYSCIAEAFLKNPLGGAATVIGSTRETFPTFSGEYMYAFFAELFTDENMRLGEVYVNSMNQFEPLTIEDSGYRWAHLSFVLLGDPSSWIHYDMTESLTVDAPGSFVLDGSPLEISVHDSMDQPLSGCQVTLYKFDEDYQRALTDEFGEVSFDLSPITPGSYNLTVDHRDARPHYGMISIGSPVDEPLLGLAAKSLGDGQNPGANGNGNGIPERGETATLSLSVSNSSDQAAHNLSMILRCQAPGVAVLDSTALMGDIEALGVAEAPDSFLVNFAGVGDDQLIPFTVEFNCDEGVFTDDFFLESAAPLHHVYRSGIDDSEFGNDDGVIDLGETAIFSLSFSNEGRGGGRDLTITASAPGGSGLSVIQGEDQLGDTAPLALDQGPATFTVERITEDPLLLDITLTDHYGAMEVMELELAYPPLVQLGPDYSFSTQPQRIILDWLPPAEDGAAAYVVLRADQPEGPYIEVSPHWIPHSTFEDDGLEIYTNYWYRIRALSAAGLRGAVSDSSKVTSNLGLKAGWPVTVAQESPSTPLVADVNGDGNFEIIVGSDRLYAFKLNGDELGDGDDDPETIGPASNLGQRYFCSLSATDLTPSPGVEVVAGSWDTGEVYVFEFIEDGDEYRAVPAPGWPREIGNPNGYGIWGTPTMGDVDGDGDMEIFVADVGGYLMAWHHDSSEVINGDGVPDTQGIFALGLGGWIRSSVAFGDVDHDDDMEIFICTTQGHLKGYDGDGNTLPGFPYSTPHGPGDNYGIFSSPVVGDVDGDGDIEIVFACENDSLYMINHDGSLHAGWPIAWPNNNASQMSPTPALADMDGDGFPEVVACANHSGDEMEVAVIDSLGVFLPGWPVSHESYTQTSPVIVDLDGDGDLEIIVGDEAAAINAWHHDGSLVGGFPLITGDWMRATPTLLDIDEDGLLDMLAMGWDKNVYIWETSTTFDPENAPWFTFMHDQKRSGNYGTLAWAVAVPEDGQTEAFAGIRLDPNWPNPFNPVTHFRFTVGGTTAQPVLLDIFDLRGRRIRTLVTEKLDPGVYQRSWDGRDDSGHESASSVYFARLRVGELSDTRKITLMK